MFHCFSSESCLHEFDNLSAFFLEPCYHICIKSQGNISVAIISMIISKYATILWLKDTLSTPLNPQNLFWWFRGVGGGVFSGIIVLVCFPGKRTLASDRDQLPAKSIKAASLAVISSITLSGTCPTTSNWRAILSMLRM